MKADTASGTVYLGMLLWGLYLRDARLRVLMPA
jgi:hypothetical protein